MFPKFSLYEILLNLSNSKKSLNIKEQKLKQKQENSEVVFTKILIQKAIQQVILVYKNGCLHMFDHPCAELNVQRIVRLVIYTHLCHETFYHMQDQKTQKPKISDIKFQIKVADPSD